MVHDNLQIMYYSSEDLKPVYTLSSLENLRRMAFTTQAGTTLLFPLTRKLYAQLVNWQLAANLYDLMNT